MKLFTLITLCWFALCPLKAQLIDFDELVTDSITDVDGNAYKIILFDDVWWMADNLKTKHYNNGSEITQATQVISYSEIGNTWETWCLVDRWAYPNLDDNYFDEYGLNYSWSASVSDSVCPEGWSLPDTSYWYNLARYVVGDDKLVYNDVTRNTPSGGTETVKEASEVNEFGRYLKTDNGKVLSTNKYGDSTWIDGGYWSHTDSISNDCNGTGMNIMPAGEMSYYLHGFGNGAFYWTPNYVHANGSGQGRMYMYFSSSDHQMHLCCNHNANMHSIRCVKDANIFRLSNNSIVLDSAAKSTDTIIVEANYYWSASTNASWLSVAQSVDSADGSIIITALSANSEDSCRTDTVFVAMDDAKTKIILVTQAGKTALFSVSDTNLKVMAAENSTVAFTISSNVDWSINSSETWLVSDVTSGKGNAEITLVTEANSDTITRTATITVESESADTSVEITVTQNAKSSLLSPVKQTSVVGDVLIYPNPVSSTLNIYGASDVQQVDVLNLSGKTVLSVKGTSAIDMSNLAGGIYMVKITTEEGVSVQKVIKQ